MLSRADEIRRAYEELLADEPPLEFRRHHVIPAAVFDAFVTENRANLLARPSMDQDTAIRPSDAGLKRMFNLVAKYSSYCEVILPATWPRLDVLHFAFWKNFQYVSFQELLDKLMALVKHAITQVRLNKDPHHLVLLALPGSHVTKSGLWFNAWAWANVPELRATVDFIVPTMDAVHKLLSQLESHPAWTATVLYIDDMAYSGTQMAEFRGKQVDTGILFYPIVAYCGEKVDINHYYFTRGKDFPMTLTTPIFNMSHWVNGMLDARGEPMIPGPLPNEEQVNRVLLKLMARPKRHFTAFALTFYELFITAVDFPVIVFEHKAADYASIAVRLFMQVDAAPDEQSELSDRQLITIGNSKLPLEETGSVAFYKKLAWTYKTAAISNARVLQSIFEVHYAWGC